MWSVAVLLAAVLSLASPASSLSAQSALQDRYFDSSGVRIRYVEAGKGTPIILVHGFTRNIETNWLETGVLSALAKRHRVIAVDLRGHGKSGKPHDPSAYEAANCGCRAADRSDACVAPFISMTLRAGKNF